MRSLSLRLIPTPARLAGALLVAVMLFAGGVAAQTQAHLTDLFLSADDEALTLTLVASAPVPAEAVALKLVDLDKVLVVRLEHVGAKRQWIELPDRAIHRALLVPTQSGGPAAILRVRFHRRVPKGAFAAATVQVEGDRVVVRLPREAPPPAPVRVEATVVTAGDAGESGDSAADEDAPAEPPAETDAEPAAGAEAPPAHEAEGEPDDTPEGEAAGSPDPTEDAPAASEDTPTEDAPAPPEDAPPETAPTVAELLAPEPAPSVGFSEVAWRSALLPGWGHIHGSERGRGAVYLTLFASVIAGAVASGMLGNRAEDDYKSGRAEDVTRRMDADMHFSRANTLWIAAGVLWTAVQMDTWLSPPTGGAR